MTEQHEDTDGEDQVISPEPLTASVSPSDLVGVVHKRDGKILAIDKPHPAERSTFAERLADGSISIRHLGSSPPGETNTQRACHTLVKKLRAEGQSWEPPRELEGSYVDCIADSGDNSERKPLQMQHVRVKVDPDYHERRGREGGVEETLSDDDVLIENIREAIQKKLEPEELLPDYRPELVLVVDAMHETEHVMGAEQAFRERHGPWLRNLDPAFKAVWLVGPTPALTFRLDDGEEMRRE